MANNNNRRGRPAGSPNVEYATVIEVPVVCPKCKSPKLSRVPGSKTITRKIIGKLPDGTPYNAVTHVRKICECKQRVVVRVFTPSRAESPANPG